MKSHYIPKFYLKRWAPEGKVTEYSRPNLKSRLVSAHSKPPKGTAWKEGLYDFDGLSSTVKHHLEKSFFLKVDGKAAEALSLLESGASDDGWKDDTRQAWVMFMQSLLLRHPVDIEAFKSVYVRDFRKVTPDQEEAYQAARDLSDPPTAEEYFGAQNERWLRNMAMNNLPNLIGHQRSGEELMNMKWSVLEPHRDGYFLTSDRPLIRTILGRQGSHWALPIGPRKLFLACDHEEILQRLRTSMLADGWKAVNRMVVRAAVGLGFASSDAHLAFFQKHLAADTRPSVFWGFRP